MARRRGGGSVYAARLLQTALGAAVGRSVTVGTGRLLGRGLSRDVYAVSATPSGDGDAAVYAVLVPRGRDPDLEERAEFEVDLLARLGELDKPFDTPRVIAVVPTPRGSAVVRECLPGIALDFRPGAMPWLEPGEVVAEVAAAVHALPLAPLGALPGHATRRAHGAAVVAALRSFAAEAPAAARVAHAWLEANLPPDAPATLLHGDLLGQNVLVQPPIAAAPQRPGLIDWEYAQRGDPAYDLAIVTRGQRRPFGDDQGLRRLVTAYRGHGGAPLQPRDVRFHELGLLLAWCRDADGPGPLEHLLRQLTHVLERARRGT